MHTKIMKTSRRSFFKKTALATTALGIAPVLVKPQSASFPGVPRELINPWIELSAKAYLHNAELISKMARGKPVLAVLKNNAYGLGDVEVARILDKSPHIHGFALVKDNRCLALRDAGVKKPILLMGDFSNSLGPQLVNEEITLSAFSKESCKKIVSLAVDPGRKVKVQLYLDTGLGRMGMPYDQTLDWITPLKENSQIAITGLFSTLTTSLDFAKEQLGRFEQFKDRLIAIGVPVKNTHIAPSLSLLQLQESHMTMVRPGILLHGSFPLAVKSQSKEYPLQPTFRLKARVIRMERLKKGETIGFSRFYEVKQDEWIATLPIGWADGYDSSAENGAKVLIKDQLYTVVNVNASHCNLVIGQEPDVAVGDIATLIGPDAPEITPQGFSTLIDGNNYLQINYKESLPKFVFDAFR